MILKRYAPVLIVVAAYCAMALIGASKESTTSDEVAHIAAGYAYWTSDDYRLQPENGNWPQRWVSLPLVLGGYALSPERAPGWRASDVWTVADHFFYDSGYDADTLLRRARLIAVLVGGALAGVVFIWSRRLFGQRGGWVSLILFAFSPTMLAHGPLATSDMMAAAFFTTSVWAIWTTLHRITPVTLAASVVNVAGLLLSKFSAPILLPIALGLILVRLSSREPTTVRWRGRTFELRGWRTLVPAFAALLVAHALVAVALIWTSYGFRYAAMAPAAPPGEFLTPWSQLLGELGVIGDVVTWSRNHHVLPEAYLYGFSQTVYYARHRVAFFNGEYSDVGGWLGFFPYAAVVKETIPALVLLAWSAIWLVRRWFRGGDRQSSRQRIWVSLYRTAPLWMLIAVYWAFALNTNLNIGHRHLLPTIPATYILLGFMGGALAPLARDVRRWGMHGVATVGLCGLLAWHAAESVHIAPHYLAYFNELDGGPSEAYRHLVDSSLDWGQDLPGLKKWLDEHGLQGPNHAPVYLSYFGNGRPEYYGIDATRLPGFPHRPREVPHALTPGIYCISATMYQGIYLDAPGPWTANYQHDYETATSNLRVFDSTASNPADRARLLRQTGEDFWWRTFDVFQQLRLARLVAYLHRRPPDANVGYSILIYRVTDGDILEALKIP